MRLNFPRLIEDGFFCGEPLVVSTVMSGGFLSLFPASSTAFRKVDHADDRLEQSQTFK